MGMDIHVTAFAWWDATDMTELVTHLGHPALVHLPALTEAGEPQSLAWLDEDFRPRRHLVHRPPYR